MHELTSPKEMRAWSRAERARGRRIGFVPTMGFLHEGHLQLVDRAKQRADRVVLSIFVNPLQFGPTEDLAQYPRDLERDRRLAAERGVDCLFVPDRSAMYPTEPLVRVLIVVNVIVLLWISPRLTFLALVIAPLLTLALQPILRKLRRGHRRLRGEYGEITSVLQEVISGVRLVKSFRGEPYEDTRFMRASDSFASGAARITRIAFLSQPLTELIGTTIGVLILWIGAQQALVGGWGGSLDGARLITFM